MSSFARWSGLLLVVVWAGAPEPGAAQETPPAPAPTQAAEPTDKPAAPLAGLEGTQQQPGDDVLERLQPKQPRTVSDQERVEALSWYATGRLLESRSDFQGAYKAYQQALARDPNSMSVLHSLIPLAMNLNRVDDLLKYVLQAAELDAGDYRMLRRLGTLLAQNGDNARALELLEKALKSPGIKPESAIYVTLQRDLGVLYRAAGKMKEAAEAFTTVFDALQNPDKYGLDAAARRELQTDANVDYEKLGQAFLDGEKPDLALKSFDLWAQSRRVNSGNLAFYLARTRLQLKEPELALTELQKYLDAQRQSKGKDAYQLLVTILTELKREADIVPELEKLAEKDARNNTLQFFLAEQYVAAGRLADAETQYKKTLASSSDAAGYAGLAGVYRRLNRPEDLLLTLAKAAARARDQAEMAAELKAIQQDAALLGTLIEAGRKLKASEAPEFDQHAAALVGRLAVEGKQTDAALEFYKLALEEAKGTELRSRLYDELTQHLMDVRRYKEASDTYRLALEDAALRDQRPNFLYMLCVSEELGGNTEAALKAISDAQQAVPGNPLLVFREAWVYAHSQNYDEAIPRLEKFLETFPEPKGIFRQAQFTLSSVYVQKGDMRKGEEILETVYKEDPEDVSVNNDLGYLYADQGKNLEQAEKMITKALAAEPENVAYLDSMGWVLFKQGKFAEALPHLEKASATSSGADATIWDHLGDVYDRLQQPAKALTAWQKALEEGKKQPHPDTKLIQRIEEKIKTQMAGSGQLRPERPGAP